MTLQHFVVRMLFDPVLVDKVYGNSTVDGLDDAGRRLLTQPDRRAWALDVYRRMRALTALLEEFPASAGQAGVATLDAYFSSEIFHSICQERGSMALGFGAWIEALAGPVARLETALARIRRPQPATEPGIRLSANAAVVCLPMGTLDQYQALRAQLGDQPIVALVEGKVRPVALPESQQSQYLLVQARPDGEISLSLTSETLALLLQAAKQTIGRAELQARARELGAEPGEEDEIIDDLIHEELLTPTGA